MRSYKTINKKKSRKKSRKNYRKNKKIGGSTGWGTVCKKSRNKLNKLKEIIDPVFDKVKDRNHENENENIIITKDVFDTITDILGIYDAEYEGPGHYIFN